MPLLVLIAELQKGGSYIFYAFLLIFSGRNFSGLFKDRHRGNLEAHINILKSLIA